MEEVKFRVWDSTPGYEMMTATITLEDIQNGFEVKGLNRKPLQYTGLKDKNGREIYQGDVVSYIENVADGHFLEVKVQVEIEPDGVNFCWWQDDVEVIGNIYENPELAV